MPEECSAGVFKSRLSKQWARRLSSQIQSPAPRWVTGEETARKVADAGLREWQIDVEAWLSIREIDLEHKLQSERDLIWELKGELARITTADWIKEEGWMSPNKQTISKANDIIELAAVLCPNKRPNIVVGEEGAVVFEWWHDLKKITLYVQDSTIHYIRSWGPDMFMEMADGVLQRVNDLSPQLAWLTFE